MTEYTYCPGYQFREDTDRPHCLSLVKVQDGDVVDYCCVNCFETSWRPIEDALWNREPRFVNHGHSRQCVIRQHDRVGETAVADREFGINGKDVPRVR